MITIDFNPLCNAHFGHAEAPASAQVYVPDTERSPMDLQSKYPPCVLLYLSTLISTYPTLCL